MGKERSVRSAFICGPANAGIAEPLTDYFDGTIAEWPAAVTWVR